MKFTRKHISLIAAAALSSCSVGPDYFVPDLKMPETFVSKAEIPTTDNVCSTQPWWSSFSSPIVSELVTRALEKNLDITQALERVQQSENLRREAISAFLPGVAVNGGSEKGRSSSARFPGGASGGYTYSVYNTGLAADWSIDIFGGLRRGLEAQSALHESEQDRLTLTRLYTATQVVSAFVDLKEAEQRARIANRHMKLQEETLRISRARFSAGETPELDVLQAKARLSETRATLPPIELAVKQNINRIAIMLGEYPVDFLASELGKKILAERTVPRFHGSLNTGTPDQTVRLRPDVAAAERRLAANTALIGVAVSELYPKISLGGSIGLEAADFSNLLDGAGTYRWGPSLSWRPFDNGTLRARVAAADSRARESMAAYEQTVLQAIAEIENSGAWYNSELERRHLLKKALFDAVQSLQTAKAQYEVGATDIVSVMEAEKAVLASRSNLVNARAGVSSALLALIQASGSCAEKLPVAKGEDESNAN
ncbi:MAG: efflux transporter outer membrane subunit [bacterium]|nr:efflux transporter outer membrane subunit [bacterium]